MNLQLAVKILPRVVPVQPIPGSPNAEAAAKQATKDASKETIPKVSDSSKGLQGHSPPSSNDNKPNPVGLGIDTTAATEDPAPATAGLPESSIDSLFDNDGSDMIFDGIDFMDSSNTQGQNDFDLSTFGNSQDFNMPDLHTANDGANTDNNSGNKQDDIFDLGNTSGGGDIMDLDIDPDTAGGVESIFADMYFVTGDDGNVGDGGVMEHGEYDNAFFGLD